MPALFLELFSEEIPARMQVRAAADLSRLVADALAALSPSGAVVYSGPRRIALGLTVQSEVGASRSNERGPRVTAPEQALAGFLRKHAAARDDVRQEGDFWVLDRAVAGIDAASLIGREIPGLLRRFPWPKSMRWGGTSRFAWVRPLRRILCILDGETVPFDLRDGDDDGHRLVSANVTEGHRFLAPGAFPVGSEAEWTDALRERYVIADASERRRLVRDGIAAKADERGLVVVDDAGLLDEVAGLVEWPVPLLGRIDDAYMDLPPEVMQVSMRVNQRYFALRDADGGAAPWFAFAANIEADDGGAAIIAGNERVLRARFSDARHFWDLDRTRTLESRVEDLKAVTFHAKIGTQYERALRLQRIAGDIAELIEAPISQSRRAGLLSKADLTTGMVGEFPELQGIMGGYYARAHEDRVVAEAVRQHYAPRGPNDDVPNGLVSVAVALADKLDQLVQFFAIGERPTGSGDPFALRRAALGIIRLLRQTKKNVRIADLATLAGGGSDIGTIVEFLKDRLAVQLRAEGQRYDVIRAAFVGAEDRIDDLIRRVVALTSLIEMEDGVNLLAAYKRAANILRDENAADGPHAGSVDAKLLIDAAEVSLYAHLSGGMTRSIGDAIRDRFYEEAIQYLARVRQPVDVFFDNVTVNSLDPDLRRNRLRLLAHVVSMMDSVADFSKIEG